MNEYVEETNEMLIVDTCDLTPVLICPERGEQSIVQYEYMFYLYSKTFICIREAYLFSHFPGHCG